jgi:hypothetical protein
MKRSLFRRTAPRVVAAALSMTAVWSVGCATSTVPINYAPSSVKTAEGALSVGEFRYLPAEPTAEKPIKANRIQNTALGQVLIDRDVKQFVRDAIFAELRFVGVKTNDASRVLTGEIEEFLIDDLGYSVDWTLRVRYLLTDDSESVVYDSVKNVQRNTAKFANVFGALNETVKLSAEQLLDDPAFLKAIAPVAAAAPVGRSQ